MVGSTKKIIGGEGVTALWKGVNAAWLREASYTSLRLGLYEPCKVAFGCTTPETTTFVKKFAAGSAAGALGSLAGNPFDVLKTKMMASEAAGTPSIVGTAKELLSKQGMAGFYRGIDSNIMRASGPERYQDGVLRSGQGRRHVGDRTGPHSHPNVVPVRRLGRFLHDVHRLAVRYDSHPIDEPTRRCQDLQQCRRLFGQDLSDRRAR